MLDVYDSSAYSTSVYNNLVSINFRRSFSAYLLHLALEVGGTSEPGEGPRTRRKTSKNLHRVLHSPAAPK